MDDLAQLSEDELFKRAKELRLQALHGDRNARQAAEACVNEANRRLSYATTLAASLEVPASRRRWWQFR
jgi:hypothetical protein